jgi:hypothetical protein
VNIKRIKIKKINRITNDIYEEYEDKTIDKQHIDKQQDKNNHNP